jgi:hypothetical protein
VIATLGLVFVFLHGYMISVEIRHRNRTHPAVRYDDGTNATEEAAGIDGFNENSIVPSIIFRKPEHVSQLIPQAEEEEEEEEKDKEEPV